MVQLILNGTNLPETTRGKYKCYEDILSVNLEMASGRMVREVRGKVYKIEYSYDYMGSVLLNELLAILRSSRPITVQYLADDAEELATGTFWCTGITNPMFAFSRNGTPYWHNVGFVLREVEPHD